MTEPPRDWDKELAAVDRAMARMPAPPATPVPADRAPRSLGAPAGGRFGTVTTWLRVLLGLALAVAITQWPYATACGLNLMIYLGAIGTVIVAGLWSSISSWRRQLGLAHTLSLLVLLWGLFLAAREVLPRIGYAKAERPWSCDAAPRAS